MPATWSCVSDSPDATRRVAGILASAVEPVPRGGLFVALSGDLGAGKTVFAGGLFHGLGVPKATPIVSPTFTVARAYRGRVAIHHLDAYHLKGLHELEAAGFEEMGGEGIVTCVEWGERIPEALPADRLEISLTPLVPTSIEGLEAKADAVPPDPKRRIEIRALGRASLAILDRALPALERSGSDASVR